MGKVLNFGEILMRICPDGDGQWLAENRLPFYVGGAELNVATALALWDVPSAYFTAMPDNFMADQLKGYLKGCGIDTSPVKTCGERIGLYYLPKGKDLKNAGVVYDRANSSFASLKPGQINWDEVLEGVTWFHFSAICPAINQDAANVCLEAVKAAAQKGIYISVDLNYRAKLWKYGKEPIEVLPQIVQYADLIMGNIWAAEKMLGVSLSPAFEDKGDKNTYLAQAEATSKTLQQQFSNCKAVANTFRFDYGAKGIQYYTTLYIDNQCIVSQEFVADEILDKVGSGDCFMAGLIYGFYNQHQPKALLDFATAAAYEKLFIPSDCTTSTIEQIQKSVKNNGQK